LFRIGKESYAGIQTKFYSLKTRAYSNRESRGNERSGESSLSRSQHGYSFPEIYGVKDVALSYKDFQQWWNFSSDKQLFPDVEVVYVVITRSLERHEAEVMFKEWREGYRTKMGFEEEEFKVSIGRSAKGEIKEAALVRAADVSDVEMLEVSFDINSPTPLIANSLLWRAFEAWRNAEWDLGQRA
jgi:hypothetical protein